MKQENMILTEERQALIIFILKEEMMTWMEEPSKLRDKGI
mgnify:CR=1 FL=1